MRIGELSARTGASVRSLRHYEKHGLLMADRGPNSYRQFSESAVETVARIQVLLAARLSVATIRQVLPCTLDATPRIVPCAELSATLRRELARLDRQAVQLAHARALISTMLAS